MPIFRFICPKCGVADRKLLTPAGGRAAQQCRKTPGCDGTLGRDVHPPSMVAKEVIDNGAMGRRVERDIDIERLVSERANKDYRQPE